MKCLITGGVGFVECPIANPLLEERNDLNLVREDIGHCFAEISKIEKIGWSMRQKVIGRFDERKESPRREVGLV